jgi:hypothetical protein
MQGVLDTPMASHSMTKADRIMGYTGKGVAAFHRDDFPSMPFRLHHPHQLQALPVGTGG